MILKCGKFGFSWHFWVFVVLVLFIGFGLEIKSIDASERTSDSIASSTCIIFNPAWSGDIATYFGSYPSTSTLTYGGSGIATTTELCSFGLSSGDGNYWINLFANGYLRLNYASGTLENLSEVSCSDWLTYAQCLTEGYSPDPQGLCQWVTDPLGHCISASSTCSLYDLSGCSTATSCEAVGTTTNAQGVELVATWHTSFFMPSFSRQYCAWYTLNGTEYGTSTDEQASSTSEDFQRNFWSLANSSDSWIRSRLEDLNPLNYAPFSWGVQMVEIWKTEIDRLENNEFATTSLPTGSIILPAGMDGTTTTVSLMQLRENTIDDTDFGSWFVSMRVLIGGVFGLIFAWGNYKQIAGWLHRHAYHS